MLSSQRLWPIACNRSVVFTLPPDRVVRPSEPTWTGNKGWSVASALGAGQRVRDLAPLGGPPLEPAEDQQREQRACRISRPIQDIGLARRGERLGDLDQAAHGDRPTDDPRQRPREPPRTAARPPHPREEEQERGREIGERVLDLVRVREGRAARR